jgi:hypothetical protein
MEIYRLCPTLLSATHYVKLSEMEIFVATVVVTFFIFENLIGACKVAPNGERRKLANEQAGERESPWREPRVSLDSRTSDS